MGRFSSCAYPRREYATIQEVFCFLTLPHMDPAIIGFPQQDIDRLAARFAKAPFSAVREKDLRLAQGPSELSLLGVCRGVPTPLSERRDVYEVSPRSCGMLSEQLFHFVEREWVDPPAIQ